MAAQQYIAQYRTLLDSINSRVDPNGQLYQSLVKSSNKIIQFLKRRPNKEVKTDIHAVVTYKNFVDEYIALLEQNRLINDATAVKELFNDLNHDTDFMRIFFTNTIISPSGQPNETTQLTPIFFEMQPQTATTAAAAARTDAAAARTDAAADRIGRNTTAATFEAKKRNFDKIEGLQGTVADLDNQIDQLRKATMMDPNIAKDIDSLSTRAASLQSAAETLKEQQETNTITTEEFNLQLQTLQDQNQALQDSANELQAQLNKQTNRNSNVVARLREMTQQSTKQDEEFRKLIKILEKKNTTIYTLEDTIEKQRKELTVYGELAAHRETTIAEMKSINQNIIDKIRQMSGNLESINIGNAADGLAIIESRINILENNINQLKKKWNDCDEKLKQCNDELDACNRGLEASKGILLKKNEEIQILKAQLALTQQQMQKCETVKQNLIAENGQLKLQLDKATEVCDARIKEANDAWDKEGKALRQQLIDIHNYLLGKGQLPPSDPTKLEESSVLKNIYTEVEKTFDDYQEKITQLEGQIEELKGNNGASRPPSIGESPSIDQSDIVSGINPSHPNREDLSAVTAYSLSSFKSDQSKLVVFDLDARIVIDNYTETINTIQNEFNSVDDKYILKVKNAKKIASKSKLYGTEVAASTTAAVASVASVNSFVVLDPATCFTEFTIDNEILKTVLENNSLVYNWRDKHGIFGILGDLSISKLVELTTQVCGVICKGIIVDKIDTNVKSYVSALNTFSINFDNLYNDAFGPNNKNRGNLSSAACVNLLNKVVESIFNLKKLAELIPADEANSGFKAYCTASYKLILQIALTKSSLDTTQAVALAHLAPYWGKFLTYVSYDFAAIACIEDCPAMGVVNYKGVGDINFIFDDNAIFDFILIRKEYDDEINKIEEDMSSSDNDKATKKTELIRYIESKYGIPAAAIEKIVNIKIRDPGQLYSDIDLTLKLPAVAVAPVAAASESALQSIGEVIPQVPQLEDISNEFIKTMKEEILINEIPTTVYDALKGGTINTTVKRKLNDPTSLSRPESPPESRPESRPESPPESRPKLLNTFLTSSGPATSPNFTILKSKYEVISRLFLNYKISIGKLDPNVITENIADMRAHDYGEMPPLRNMFISLYVLKKIINFFEYFKGQTVGTVFEPDIETKIMRLITQDNIDDLCNYILEDESLKMKVDFKLKKEDPTAMPTNSSSGKKISKLKIDFQSLRQNNLFTEIIDGNPKIKIIYDLMCEQSYDSFESQIREKLAKNRMSAIQIMSIGGEKNEMVLLERGTFMNGTSKALPVIERENRGIYFAEISGSGRVPISYNTALNVAMGVDLSTHGITASKIPLTIIIQTAVTEADAANVIKNVFNKVIRSSKEVPLHSLGVELCRINSGNTDEDSETQLYKTIVPQISLLLSQSSYSYTAATVQILIDYLKEYFNGDPNPAVTDNEILPVLMANNLEEWQKLHDEFKRLVRDDNNISSIVTEFISKEYELESVTSQNVEAFFARVDFGVIIDNLRASFRRVNLPEKASASITTDTIKPFIDHFLNESNQIMEYYAIILGGRKTTLLLDIKQSIANVVNVLYKLLIDNGSIQELIKEAADVKRETDKLNKLNRGKATIKASTGKGKGGGRPLYSFTKKHKRVRRKKYTNHKRKLKKQRSRKRRGRGKNKSKRNH